MAAARAESHARRHFLKRVWQHRPVSQPAELLLELELALEPLALEPEAELPDVEPELDELELPDALADELLREGLAEDETLELCAPLATGAARGTASSGRGSAALRESSALRGSSCMSTGPVNGASTPGAHGPG